MPKDVVSLTELFAGRIFQIPSYQRGYAWRHSQLADLFDDIDLLPARQRHYTGTIVFLPRLGSDEIVDAAGARYRVVDIVDGQQRLTTVIMLANALAPRLADERRASLGGLVSLKLETGISQPRLIAQNAADFFRLSVLGLGGGQSALGPRNVAERRLLEAKRIIEQYVSSVAADGDVRLNHLHDVIAHRLRFSTYEVDDESEVGVIFEVMNDRGKPLTEMEKAKNYLMYVDSKLDLPTHDLDDEVNKRFGRIYEELMLADLEGDDAEDQLLRAHWFATQDPDSKAWKGNKSIKLRFSLRDHVDDHGLLLRDATGYVQSLADASAVFADLMRPDRGEAYGGIEDPGVRQEIKAWGHRLNLLGVKAALVPLLISARLVLSSEGTEFLRLLRLLEVFSARVYELGGWTAATAQGFFRRQAHELYCGGATAFEGVMEDITGRLLYHSPDDLFEAIVRHDHGTYVPPVKYLLFEYERHLVEASGVTYSGDFHRSSLQIEHILPQHPDDPCWTEVFPEEERKRWIGDIGNLVLADPRSNAGMSNKCYMEKVGYYSKSILHQENELIRHWGDAWTRETITERRNKIADWAIDRWRVSRPAEGPSPDDIRQEDEQESDG